MLRNHYYSGYVSYCGVEYRGSHPQIISQGLFTTVQAMLDTTRVRGARYRKHDHYLNGLLFCAQCGHRLVFTQSKHRYNYYCCTSRQEGRQCQQPYIPVALIEGVISDKLHSVSIAPKDRIAIKHGVDSLLKHEIQQSKVDEKLQDNRIHRLLDEQQKVLQAYYEDAISAKLLAKEKKRLTKEVKAAYAVKADVQEMHHLACIHKEAALKLTSTFNFRMFYDSAMPQVKRYFNQSLFSKLYINDLRPISRISGNHNVQLEQIDVHEKLDVERVSKAILGLLYSTEENS
jgi:hypothetical protein